MKSRFKSYSGKEKLYKKIGALLKNNWQVLDVFEYLKKKHEDKKDVMMHINPEYHFLKHAYEVISGAGSLPDAFEGWVTPTELVIIKTGEETGAYDEAFDRCISLELEVKNIVWTVRKSLFMPVMACIILVGMLVGAKTSLMPILLDLVPMHKWTEMSKSFYDLATAVGGNPEQTFSILIGIAFFIKWSTPNLIMKFTPSVRDTLDRFFMPYSIYKSMQISIFLKSLSSLLTAGIRFRDALDLIHKTSNKYMKRHVGEMFARVTSAEDSSSVFETKFLGEYGEDLSALAKGDNLEGALIDVSNECMKKVTKDLPAKMSFIGTLFMITIVCVIIFGVVAFYDVVGILQSGDF